MTVGSLIAVRGVSKALGHVQVLHDVTLEVGQGEAVALVGPSGSGKTTLLRLVAGLEVPDSGSVVLGGTEVSGSGWAHPPHERGIGMVFQRPALWPHLTVAQNVRFGLIGRPRADVEQRLREMLRFAVLEGLERRYPHQLSGGEAQRVALARALAPGPSILLLDEPLSSLDPALREQMVHLVRSVYRETGTTLVYVTHDPDEAATTTERMVELRHGRVVRSAAWPDGLRPQS